MSHFRVTLGHIGVGLWVRFCLAKGHFVSFNVLVECEACLLSAPSLHPRLQIVIVGGLLHGGLAIFKHELDATK